MLRRFRLIGVLALLLALLQTSAGTEQLNPGPGCTVIYAAADGVALGGNNEDGFNPLTKIWFVPGVEGGYGSVWVGYDDLVIQGGMNEAGLFFDAAAVRDVTVPPKPGKPEYTGGSAFAHLMSACESIDCVRRFYEETSLPGTWNGQALFGDRFGDSAIVEPLTIIPKDGAFQVATNFFQSEVPPTKRTDARYVQATLMLGEADVFSADLLRDVLQRVRQQGEVNTLYSTVYDLQAQTIDLYYFGDFATKVTFDLNRELAKGIHAYDIPSLFASNPTAESLAGPIRSRVAAVRDEMPEAIVTAEDLTPFVGTYQLPPSVTLEVQADGNVLMGREQGPWVTLRALSATTFAHVYSDPTGEVAQRELRFNLGPDGVATSVRIGDGAGNEVVANRTGPPGSFTPQPLPMILAALAAAVLAVVLLRWRARAAHAPVRVQ